MGNKKVVVTESENKTNAHICEICKKEFAGPKTLKIHQRVHIKEKEDKTEESEKKPGMIERKRKSETVLQQPEVVLSAGNDSSNSEKSEKKPKMTPPSKKSPNKPGAFSRGGYVKRRRKPKVAVQKTSSTESEAVVSPILNEVFSQVLKNSKEDSEEPTICEKEPEIGEKSQKVESLPEKTNTPPPSISSFTMNLFARKPRLQLVPYVVEEDSDSSTVKTSPDEQSGDDNNKITGQKSSQFSRENNTASVKRKRKRKSDTVQPKPEAVQSTGNDSSASASTVD